VRESGVGMSANCQKDGRGGQGRSRRQFIDGLRGVAGFYEQNQEAYYDGMRVTLCMFVDGSGAKRALGNTARAFGRCEKGGDEKHVMIARQFGDMVKVELFAPRNDVCRPVILGTRLEPAVTVPATREIRIPQRVIDVLGWKCDPLLARES
jgi:hypothetical protein